MQAMILAAGRGERMRPLTDTCPKPLLEAGGKPLIVRHVERLRAAGFDSIVINHAHLGERIESTLGDGCRYGLEIRYSAETSALETAGGIRKALPLLGDGPFLVINGDVHCDVDLAALRRIGTRHCTIGGDLAYLLLVANPDHHPQGDFALEGSRVRREGSPRYTFSGIGIYRAELFGNVPEGQKAPLGPLLRAAMDEDRVAGAVHAGYWLDVGTPQRLEALDRHLRAGKH